jgi:hypothetical protein
MRKRIVSGLVVALVAFLAFTWWALEWDGVAVVETTAPDGTTRATHVWFVEHEGRLWLEAGEPEHGWFADLGATPRLRVAAPPQLAGAYGVEILPNPDGHRRIRALLREKYGFRDWWIAVVFDTSRSVAVRLVTGG